MTEPKLRPLFKGGPIFNYNSKAFSLCTDSVLLADFALCLNRNIKHFTELGCGSGAMSLLIAHSFPNSKGVLLDISDRAIEAAKENFALNSMEGGAELFWAMFPKSGRSLNAKALSL